MISIKKKNHCCWYEIFLHPILLNLVPRMLKLHIRASKSFKIFEGSTPPDSPKKKGTKNNFLVKSVTLLKPAGCFSFYWNPWDSVGKISGYTNWFTHWSRKLYPAVEVLLSIKCWIVALKHCTSILHNNLIYNISFHHTRALVWCYLNIIVIEIWQPWWNVHSEKVCS